MRWSLCGSRRRKRRKMASWNRGQTSTPDNPGNSKIMLWIRDVALTWESDECLTWPFGRLRGEYGTFGRNDKSIYAHRYICQLVHGDPPSPDSLALHSCGKGHEGCVNKKHLGWGTGTQNQLDRHTHRTSMTFRGRYRLTATQVAEIRALTGKEPSQVTAKRYDVTESNIRKIQTFKTWKLGVYAPHGLKSLAAPTSRSSKQ